MQVEDVRRVPAGMVLMFRRGLSRLGCLLIDRGVIGAAQLNAAIVEQRVSHRPLHEVLVEQGGVTPARCRGGNRGRRPERPSSIWRRW